MRHHKVAYQREILFGNIIAQSYSDGGGGKDAAVGGYVGLGEGVMGKGLVENGGGVDRLSQMLAVGAKVADVVQMVVGH